MASFLCVVISTVLSSVLLLCHDQKTIRECSNRYEFRTERVIYHESHDNCTEFRKIYPSCQEEVKVVFSHAPPYATWGEGRKVHGLIADMLILALQTCCYECSTIKFVGPMYGMSRFTEPGPTVILPVQSASKSTKYMGRDFVPFINLKKVVFVAKENSKKQGTELSQVMYMAVLKSWPLFVIALLMAIVAGCVVWVLDMFFNRSDFPTSFPRGPFEGFWWAFVSMTTVGYGDHAPKSLIAKLFAILWIMLGITIFTMFTATLSTALSANIDGLQDTSIEGQRIAGLNVSGIARTAVKLERAHFVPYRKIVDMISALEKDVVDAVVLDENLAKYYRPLFDAKISNLRKHHDRNIVGTSYGIVIQGDQQLAEFLRSFFETNEDNKMSMLNDVIHGYWPEYHNIKENQVDRTRFFDAESSISVGTVITLILVGVFTVMIGFTCKWVVKRHREVLPNFVKKQIVLKKKQTDAMPMLDGKNHTIMDHHAIEKCIKELDDLKFHLNNLLVGSDDVNGKIPTTEIREMEEDH